MHILIVEDEDSIRGAMLRGLGRLGSAVGAASLAEARSAAAERRPDALVTDLKLPDGSGLDLARQLGLPFVLMSGYATFDDAVTALRLGCLDIFTKPAPIAGVREALRRGLGGSALQVVDPEDGSLALVAGGLVGDERWAGQAASWAGPAEAEAAIARLAPLAPGPRQRLAIHELVQALPAGRLVVNSRGASWLAWLRGGAPSEPVQRWLEAQGVQGSWRGTGCVVTLPAEAGGRPEQAWLSRPALAADGSLDCSGALVLGSWVLNLLAERPGLVVHGLGAVLREAWQRQGLALHSPPSAVGNDERKALLGDIS